MKDLLIDFLKNVIAITIGLFVAKSLGLLT